MLKSVLQKISSKYPNDPICFELVDIIEDYEKNLIKRFNGVSGADISLVYQMLYQELNSVNSALNKVLTQKIKIWEGSCVAELIYQDAKKETSERKVEIQKLYKTPMGEYYIKGFCYLRQDVRDFKVSGILSAKLRNQECSDHQKFVALVMGNKNKSE